MERKSGEKQEKINFDDLSHSDQMIYHERASYLINRGYCETKSIEQLAREIYESNWRVSL